MAADIFRTDGDAPAAATAAAQASADGLPTVVCERGDVLVMQDAKGYPYTIVNSPYNRLRYISYAGRRIMYSFDKDNVVEETYTPGVFNCRMGGRLVQISDTAAVTTSILEMNRDAYVRLCKSWLDATIQKEYIDMFVNGNRRLSYDKNNNMYLVDGGMFKVDADGNALMAKHADDGARIGYGFLCIVNTEARHRMDVVDPQLGRISISEKTQMVVGKLMFLLHPTGDRVFLDQLDPFARAHAMRLIADGPPKSTYDMPRYDDMRGGEAPYAEPAAEAAATAAAAANAPAEPGADAEAEAAGGGRA